MTMRDAMVEARQRYLDDVLARNNGNIAAAAREAGIDRTNFKRALSRAGVDRRPRRQRRTVA